MPLYVDRQRISCKAGNKEKVFRPFHGRRRKYKEIAVCWRRKEAEETILTTSTVLEKRLPSAQLGGALCQRGRIFTRLYICFLSELQVHGGLRRGTWSAIYIWYMVWYGMVWYNFTLSSKIDKKWSKEVHHKAECKNHAVLCQEIQQRLQALDGWMLRPMGVRRVCAIKQQQQGFTAFNNLRGHQSNLPYLTPAG